MLDNEWSYTSKREVFDHMGSNVFLVVSPGRVACYVSDPDVIQQITTRRADFPKPVELYKGVDIFGKSVVSTEGMIWRHHRKLTSPSFTEKSNMMVWKESLHQGQAMVDSFLPAGQPTSAPTLDLGAASMHLSLHVIARAGFGVHLLWPHEELASTGHLSVPPPGHALTYKDALSTLLEHIIQAFLLPQWFLARSPLRTNKVAYQALCEWRLYMQEMYASKRAEVADGASSASGMDLLGALVRGAGVTPDSKAQLLTDDEILGNAFVFILAGHETTANTIHFSLVQLAMHPSSQRALQASIDSILGTREPDSWSFDDDLPRLAGSLTGAVMNETLRLWPPVTGIPKSVAHSGPQPLVVGGKRVSVPPGALVNLNTIGAHYDPKNWPHSSPADLKTFRPERWIPDGVAAAAAAADHRNSVTSGVAEDEDDQGGDDVAPGLFRPRRGAYLPFSDGPRACLGRRFAQVEVLAVLAVIFQKYSVELAVEEIVCDGGWPFAPSGQAGLEKRELLTDEKEKRGAWVKAKGKVEDLFRDGMGTVITLQMRKGRVPVRFVRRGEERFVYDE